MATSRMRSGAIVSTFALAMAMSVSSAVIVPDTTQALDFKKVGKQFRKDFSKARKSLNKSGVGKRIIQGVGVGLLVGGITGDSPAAAIIGVALIAAPVVFKEDMARKYGDEMAWSACTRCYKQRIVLAPGRSVSDKTRSAVSAKVKEDIKDIQRALANLGLYKKKIDGDFGPGSRSAVKQFQVSLGEPETGYLTAEQRYLLFTRASEAGYVREAALDRVDDSFGAPVKVSPQRVSAPAVTPAVAAIPEYRLAQSRFDRFATDFLMAGGLSAVKGAELQPDGLIAIEVLPAGGGEPRKIVASMNDIEIKPHDLSDQWIRITYNDPTPGAAPVILNTRDDFTSVDDASGWLRDGESKVAMLSKLTGVEQAPTLIADGTGDAPEVAAADPAPAPGTGATAGSDGRIVLNAPEKASAPEPSPQTADAAPQSPEDTQPHEVAAAEDGTIRVSADETPVETANSLAGFEDSSAGETCRQSIYVSFDFPNGDDPISHFNIDSPEGTILIDNGDSTAYISGSCIQGDYDFSYVAIQEGKTENDWKDFKREGSFEIASNSEQCAVDLNTPDGAATMQCY
ncbi:peptidoglycan-binding domain-containing protein [Hoeflea sp.]|uniref:peptidoglycan-binding domain-containing protein n=1 Tax=Hoeflea sp. TaxID=1940281 RepID=UPI003A8F1C07